MGKETKNTYLSLRNFLVSYQSILHFIEMETLRVDNNSISIFQKRKDNIHGIFSLLQTLGYADRYKLISNTQPISGNVANLDKFYENKNLHYQSSKEDPTFIVQFDSPFLLSGYSLVNRVYNGGNSFPRGWSIYGTNSDNIQNLMLLDHQEKQRFCDSDQGCNTVHINTYETLNVYRYYKPYKTYYFKQTDGQQDYL